MKLVVRPIDVWPGKLRSAFDRKLSNFSASWSSTVELLERESEKLGAHLVVAQLAITERDCRLDGWIRADARPTHPGVILTIEGRDGPLRFSTDLFEGWGKVAGWQANVRAIALGLEALRKVDRYGITSKGEQYVGWKALGSGTALPERAAMSPAEAARVFLDLVGEEIYEGTPGEVLDDARSGDPAGALKSSFRLASKVHHPDHGGALSTWAALDESWRVLRDVIEAA